jgi:hypothetical protein
LWLQANGVGFIKQIVPYVLTNRKKGSANYSKLENFHSLCVFIEEMGPEGW